MVRFALAAAVVAVSFSAPFVHLAKPASGLAVAALRIAIAALVFNLVTPGAWPQFARLPRRDQWLVALAGGMLGAHFGTWITSLYLTSTASSVTLVALQPVFAAVFGSMLLGDAVTRRATVGIGIAVLGTAVLAGSDWSASADALLGDALALTGAALAAAYLTIGRALRGAFALRPYLTVVNTFAGAGLLVATAVAGVPVIGLDVHSYAWIAAAATVGSLVGHTLLNWSVRRAPAHLVTLAILGEPVGATLLSWAIISEQPPAVAALGGAIILAGIFVGFRAPRTG